MKKYGFIILSICLIILFAMAISPKTFQNDTFFSFAVGNKIINEGIYENETFTFHDNLKYKNVRWIFDVTITFINNTCGYLGVYIFVITFASLIGLVTFSYLYKYKNKKVESLVLTMIIMHFATCFYCARSQVVSTLLFIIEFIILEKIVTKGNIKWIIMLLLDACLIANVHATVFPIFFVIILPYLGEYILSKISLFKKTINGFEIREISGKALAIVFCVSILGSLISPINFAQYTDALKTVGEVSTDFIQEMSPMNIMYTMDFVIIITVFIGTSLIKKTKYTIAELLYIFGFSLMAISSIRYKVFLITIGSIIVSKKIMDILENEKIEIPQNKWIKCLETLIVIAFVITSVRMFISRLESDYVDADMLPRELTEFLLMNYDFDDDFRMYNNYANGSYLEYFGIPVFIDSRAEIYLKTFNNTNILEDYYEYSEYRMSFDEFCSKYKFNHLLVDVDERVARDVVKSDDWKLVYQDDNFMFYDLNV